MTRIIAILVVLLVSNCGVSAIGVTPCPIGYTANDGYCYKVVQSIIGMGRARQQCQAQGADLTSIDSVTENNFVGRMIKSVGCIAWIGLVKSAASQHQWLSTKRSPTYRNWRSGEPNDAGENKPAGNCVMMYYTDYTWNDGGCNSNWPSCGVCKTPINTTLGRISGDVLEKNMETNIDIPTEVRVQLINLYKDAVLIHQDGHLMVKDQPSWDRETYFIIHELDGQGRYMIESLVHRGKHLFGSPKYSNRCGLYHVFYNDQAWTFERGDIYREGIKLRNNEFGGYMAGTEPVRIDMADNHDQYWRIQVVEEVHHMVIYFDQKEIDRQMESVTPTEVAKFTFEYRGRPYVAHPKLAYTVTAENSFSHTEGIDISSTVEFSAGFMGIVNSKYSLSLGIGFQMTWGKSTWYSHTIEETLDVTITNKSLVAVLVLRRGNIDLSYTSITYLKGGSVVYGSGKYKGVAFGDIYAYVE